MLIVGGKSEAAGTVAKAFKGRARIRHQGNTLCGSSTLPDPDPDLVVFWTRFCSRKLTNQIISKIDPDDVLHHNGGVSSMPKAIAERLGV